MIGLNRHIKTVFFPLILMILGISIGPDLLTIDPCDTFSSELVDIQDINEENEDSDDEDAFTELEVISYTILQGIYLDRNICLLKFDHLHHSEAEPPPECCLTSAF